MKAFLTWSIVFVCALLFGLGYLTYELREDVTLVVQSQSGGVVTSHLGRSYNYDGELELGRTYICQGYGWPTLATSHRTLENCAEVRP